mgnify:FL=1
MGVIDTRNTIGQIFTMVITGSGSNPTKGTTTTDLAIWKKNADYMEITYSYVQTAAGSAGSGYYKFAIPSGYTIDTTKALTTNNNSSDVGTATAYNGSLVSTGIVSIIDSTHFVLTIGADTLATNQVGSAFYQLSTTALNYGFTARVPIVGWS